MKKSTEMSLFVLFVFGWQGPMMIWVGIRDADLEIIVIGLIFSYPFWVWLGLWSDGIALLKGFFKKNK